MRTPTFAIGLLLLALPLPLFGTIRAAVPYDAARVYWNTTTILPLRGEAASDDPSDTRVRAQIYEFLTVGTRDVGVKGLSVEVSGWMVGELVDPFDEYETDGFRGDLLYGHVQWMGLEDNLRVRLGRQFVWQGAGNGLVLDGLHVSGDLPADLEISAYGGWVAPVRFRYGEDERVRDYAFGARFAYAPWDWGHIGVSYGREGANGGELGREQLGITASLTHFEWMEAYGYALVDLVNKDLDQGRAVVDFLPMEGLRVELEYEGMDTTSLLSKTSIFSVFSDEVYHALGGSVDWQSEGMLGLRASYRRFVYAVGDGGDRISGEARLLFDEKTRDVVGVEYGRLSTEGNAYHQIRAYARYTVAAPVFLAADVNNFFYDVDVRGYSRTHFADLVAGWDIMPGMRLEGDFGVTIDPRFQYELHGLIRFSYEGAVATGG